jgi:pimeloyl-ACP methyl ester carboxylesterase
MAADRPHAARDSRTCVTGAPDVIYLELASGLTIRALDWGGPAPAVVLLHPNGFCGGLYDPIADRLRTIARPVAFDLRGHGGSSAPRNASRYGFEALAADVLAALDLLGIERAAGVGGSLGGGVAILVDRLDPGRWSRLLLAEPVAFPSSIFSKQADNPMAAAARRRRRTFDSEEQAIRSYRRKPPLSQLAPEALEAYVRWGTVRRGRWVDLACAPEVEATIFEVSATPMGAADAWQHLGDLSCAATIVAGDDTFLPDIFTSQASRAGADLVMVPGGHFVLHEDTDRGVALVRRFALDDPIDLLT